MKIAYLFQNPYTCFSESFAVQLHIYHLIHNVQQAGHHISLVAPQGRRVFCASELEKVRNNDLTSEHFGKLGMSSTLPYQFFESGVRRVQTELRLPYFALFDSHRMYEACRLNLQGYDLIHERYNLLGLGGAMASRKLGIPYVLEVNADMIAERDFQGTPEQGARRQFGIWATRYCLNTARKIISVSTHLKDHLVKEWSLDHKKIVVLPNGADTNSFAKQYDTKSIRREFDLNNEPIIMFIGGFYPWHDLSLLLDSFTQVQNSVPDARLFLVGDGRNRAVVEQKIEDNGIQQAVILTGAIEHSRIPQMLSIADVAVAPNIEFFSGHGGSPLKLFEYMAAGKAIVATNTGQVGEIIQDAHTGLLVEPGDVRGFAHSIRVLLADPVKRQCLGQAASRQAAGKHSWKQYAEQLVGIYANVIRD